MRQSRRVEIICIPLARFFFSLQIRSGTRGSVYELLRGQTEQTIEICGGYPVNLAENVTDLLKSAVHNEMQEFEDVYPEFAKIAKEEGFDQAKRSI